jgi:hypothetical protein
VASQASARGTVQMAGALISLGATNGSASQLFVLCTVMVWLHLHQDGGSGQSHQHMWHSAIGRSSHQPRRNQWVS